MTLFNLWKTKNGDDIFNNFVYILMIFDNQIINIRCLITK